MTIEEQRIRSGFWLGFVAGAAIAVLIFVFALLPNWSRIGSRSLKITTHFKDASGLKRGAAVRMAGVEIGTVRDVRVRPDLKTQPVEVTLSVNPRAAVPRDAIAELETAGVLGETFVDIDVAKASAPGVADGGSIEGLDSPSVSAQEVIDRLTAALNHCASPAKGSTSQGKVAPSH